jgi:LmbE family N-acetylglucosaminyl deacetylase
MARWIIATFAVLSVACGDNDLGPGVPLAKTKNLVLIAHQDDDLIFMQPDVIEAVQRGDGVTNVYVTAGNDNKGPDAADPRYEGLRQAYGAAAGDMNWDCGWITVDFHLAQHCRLADENVSLLFLAFPDGGECGQFPGSLLQLWNGTITTSTTVAHRTATYDQPQLIATIAEIIGDTRPDVIRTLDVTSNHGHDHVDHEIVGALTLLALATTDQHPEVIDYRGYDVANEAQNKIQPIFDFVHPILGRYEACTSKCGAPCGSSCTTIDASHDTWLGRRYAFGFRSAGTGLLETNGTCLFGDGTLGDCASAPSWSLDADGELATAGGCLTVAADGSLGVSACGAGVAQRLFFDDEGHMWSAVPPLPQGNMEVAQLDCPTPPTEANMEFAHLDCLTPSTDGTSATAALCGQGQAPTWELVPELVTTSRATIGLAATGRAMRLGDLTGDGLADLCSVTATDLMCAPGDGAGHFGAAIHIADLAIDPDSLAIGDVDGDGIADACGRTSTGTTCALSTQAYASAGVSGTFGDPDMRADTASSIQIADAKICGAGAQGVECAPAGLSFQAALVSTWPDPSATVWPADLDGDGSADWCAATATGPACGVASQMSLTTDGAPWMYSNGGVADSVPDDPALTAIADIDGDGAADLCAIAGTSVMCARSQHRGFGPLATWLVAPSAPVALWLGDLDGDGRADACVDLGDTIACALSR